MEPYLKDGENMGSRFEVVILLLLSGEKKIVKFEIFLQKTLC
jgi:hypothetical protein